MLRLIRGVGMSALALFFAACEKKTEFVQQIDRGSLRCTEYVQRGNVNNYWWEITAGGQPFKPDGRRNKVGGCQASRNTKSEILVVILGDACYAVRIEQGSPTARVLSRPDGMDSLAQFKSARWSCDGRCLVWKDRLVFVDSGEVRTHRPLAGDILGVSPDLKTAVLEAENAAGVVSIEIVDLETGTASRRNLPAAEHPWLQDYREGSEAVASHFRWQRLNGKDRLTFP